MSQRDAISFFAPLTTQDDAVPALRGVAGLACDLLDTLQRGERLGAFATRVASSPTGSSPDTLLRWSALLLVAWASGMASSRRIAAACETDSAFALLAGEEPPRFEELRALVKLHRDAVIDAQATLLVALGELGLRRFLRVPLDPIRTAPTPEARDAAARDAVLALAAIAAGDDRDDDRAFGPDVRGDELPEILAEPAARRARIAAVCGSAPDARPASSSPWDETTQLIDLAEVEGSRLPETGLAQALDEGFEDDALSALDEAFGTPGPLAKKRHRPSAPAVTVRTRPRSEESAQREAAKADAFFQARRRVVEGAAVEPAGQAEPPEPLGAADPTPPRAGDPQPATAPSTEEPSVPARDAATLRLSPPTDPLKRVILAAGVVGLGILLLLLYLIFG